MERSGQTGTVTYKIIREDTFDGIPCFVIHRATSERYYTKDVLGFLARKRGGEVVVKRSAPQQPYAWPLRVGKKWRNVFTLQRVQKGSSTDVDRQVVVSKLEEVTVPAGKFKTFRIEVYRSHDGRLVSEWWYAPDVRSFVKNIRYLGRGREERLISYKID